MISQIRAHSRRADNARGHDERTVIDYDALNNDNP
jgi:hypothetical protein